MRPEDYLKIVWRRWWLAPLIALVAASVAYVLTDRQPRVYTSSTELMAIAEPPEYFLDLYAKNRLASYKKLIADSRVIGRAVERGQLNQLGLDAGSVMAKLAVAHNPDTNTVQIAVSDSDPHRAARIANAVAAAFIEQNEADNEALQRTYPRSFDTQGRRLETRNNEVRLVQLNQAGPAALPSAPRPKLNAVAAAILGVALALVLAFALEYLDDTLRTTDEVRRYLDLPLVATIPNGTRPGIARRGS